LKELDFSSFDQGVTPIPQGFYSYFEIKDKNKKIRMLYENVQYSADLTWFRPSSPVIRISWDRSFTNLLRKKFPTWNTRKPHDKNKDMKMVFKKTNKKNIYQIELVDRNTLQNELINFQLKVSRKIKKSPKIPSGNKNPNRKHVLAEQITRDPEVHAWVLYNSKWICECCDNPAPFSKLNGASYLEVHHLKRLADGGSDTVENAVAVCPNCHRELHYGEKRTEILDALYSKVRRTIRE